MIGLRVVRGPDWKWGNQDGGKGHVGTVVTYGKSGTHSVVGTAVVQWDSGVKENYRIGHQDAYDLQIVDNASAGVVHPDVFCDLCEKDDDCISGMRWKCSRCSNFDLCTECYMSDKHDLTHQFLLIETQGSQGVEMPKREGSEKVRMKGIFPSAKVTRGPDWDWNDQDGGKGNIGTVVNIKGWDVKSERSVATVTWPSGFTNIYRVGHNGKMDLKCVEFAFGDTYYKDHLPVLKMSKIYEVSSVREDVGNAKANGSKDKKCDEESPSKKEESENVKEHASEDEDSDEESSSESEDFEDVKTNGSENQMKEIDDELSFDKTKDCENITIKETESGTCKHKGFILLCQNVEELFNSGKFCDFTVKVKDCEFQIHKAILAARSSVFASMLQHDMKEKNTGVVEINDCEPDTFKEFLFYLYSGKTDRLSIENAAGLYEAAEKYDVQGLKDECVHFLKENLSVDIFCDVMKLAIIYKDKELIKQATDFFIVNTQEILLTVKWQIFMKEHSVPANELYIKAFRTVLNK